MAFWINAYNALVLRTVDRQLSDSRQAPRSIPPTASARFPARSSRRTHRVAGRAVTLDAIEKEILTPLGDARVFLALGRGAVGGGRLRSEAFDAARLEEQLNAVAAESLDAQRDRPRRSSGATS